MCNEHFDSTAQIGNKCYGGFISRIYLCLPMYILYAYIHTDTQIHRYTDTHTCSCSCRCMCVCMLIHLGKHLDFGRAVGWKGG